MTKRYVPLILTFIFLAGCSREICKVGDIRITEKDIIKLSAKVSEVYYPKSGKRYVALSQLINGYLSLQVLKSLRYKIDDNVLKKETERIDKNTKVPHILKKIKRCPWD